MEHIPAEQLVEFNQMVRSNFRRKAVDGIDGSARKIFIRRLGKRGVANIDAVEELLSKWGFRSYVLENLSFAEQISLFMTAEFIIAPHGAGLANLIVCGPGTNVLELMPTAQMRPCFWQLSNKIGLAHGLMFCPPAENDPTLPPFDNQMIVDLDRLSVLCAALEARA